MNVTVVKAERGEGKGESKEWQTSGTILYHLDPRLKVSTSILNVLALDLDNTIIETSSPNINSSWKIYNDLTVTRLKEWIRQGWYPVIFSNRADAASSLSIQEALKKKLDAVTRELGVPIDIFVAMSKDKNRKPETGMWDLFLKLRAPHVGGYTGYYVGDAEGQTSSVPKYRWSDSDKKFAENIKLTFVTPDTMFEK